MDMSKLQILDSQRKTFRDTMRPRVFAELQSIWLRRSSWETDMVRLLTGGRLEVSSTRCFADSHLSTAKIRTNSSATSSSTNHVSIFLSWARTLETSATSSLTKTLRIDSDLAQRTLRRSSHTRGSLKSTGTWSRLSSSLPLTSLSWTETRLAPSTSCLSSLSFS